MNLFLLLLGCYQLDGFFFNGEAVDAYTLDSVLVPDDCIELVSFDGDAGALYGVWAHQPEEGAEACEPGVLSPDAPVILYFHGNAANIDVYWQNVEFYWESGFTVFIFDYRGYGRSPGDSSFQGVLDDGAVAIDAVSERTGLDSTELNYVGLSLGGFVAVQASVSRPPRALVTEDLFASTQKMLDDGTMLDLPAGWFFVENFDNAAAAGRLPSQVPYLVVHGAEDSYIQPEHATLVYDAASSATKELLLIPGVDHADTIPENPDAYRPTLECWLALDCPSE